MNLQTNRFEHQKPAVAKLLPTRVGALFMDMGTGKTRCAIELIARRLSRIDHVLWFCPVSLKDTIRFEIAKHTDLTDDQIAVFDDKTNQRDLDRSALVYVIGLESLGSSDRVTLAANALIIDQSYVVVDESSYIKGHQAKRTQRVTTMAERARYRLLLTGTPISQGVVDLFSQMRFLSPAILGYQSFYSFAANHLEYSEKHPGKIVRAHNVDHLAAKMQPYIYQVTKEECHLALPEKLNEARYYHLSEDQKEAYWQAKDKFAEEAMSYIDELYALFRLFTALQEIVSGFWNRDGVLHEFEHDRLHILSGILEDIPDGEKVIIWCKFQHSVTRITEMLTREHGAESVAQYHGGLGEHERSAELSRWRREARFLVATMATGGHGKTLTEASYAIFYENGFKYAERIQAEDRIHRIGQVRPCTYIDIVALKSIDERIQKALGEKANVVESFRRKVQQVKDERDQAALKALVLEL